PALRQEAAVRIERHAVRREAHASEQRILVPVVCGPGKPGPSAPHGLRRLGRRRCRRGGTVALEEHLELVELACPLIRRLRALFSRGRATLLRIDEATLQIAVLFPLDRAERGGKRVLELGRAGLVDRNAGAEPAGHQNTSPAVPPRRPPSWAPSMVPTPGMKLPRAAPSPAPMRPPIPPRRRRRAFSSNCSRSMPPARRSR